MKRPTLWSAVISCSLFTITPRGWTQSSTNPAAQQTSLKQAQAVLLENLTWDEAERVLTPDAVIVIPLGAECKEHGRHLQLNNDFLMAEYFKHWILAAAPKGVIVAPTINYSFYPAFLEYPGSTSLSMDTARAMITEIVRSLARYGPRRFYVLNTGISTLKPLAQAATELAKDGILLRYTDLTKEDPVEKKVRQSAGTHADEIETSMMLYIAPDSVQMKKAARDLNLNQPGGLTRGLGRSDSRHSRKGPSCCGIASHKHPERDWRSQPCGIRTLTRSNHSCGLLFWARSMLMARWL